MPVARALRLPITAVVAALALSGCMSTSGPVAVGPQGVDAVTYGPAYASAPVADVGGGGAISALRSAFASASPGYGYAAPGAAPVVYAAAPGGPAGYDNSYHLGPGDKLRVVVYGQEGLTNSYAVGASGAITMPLIGSVQARGLTPAQLASRVSDRLRNGYIREPYVAAEIEAYRPFFILGEVAAPGQYPYVPNMTAESAVAIAGGFSPRAKRDSVTLTHTSSAGTMRAVVPPATPINPGDTIVVGERWF